MNSEHLRSQPDHDLRGEEGAIDLNSQSGTGSFERSVSPKQSPKLLPLLSSAEVQELLDRNERTLRRWAVRGFLLPLRVGRSVFYRRDDIDQLITRDLAPE